MSTPAEDYAHDLGQALTALFDEPSSSPPTITVSWRQMCWKCAGEGEKDENGRSGGARRCLIECYDREGAPRYCVHFYHELKERAPQGYTQDQAELLCAVRAWMDGATLEALYEQFAFVDASRRAQPQVVHHYGQEDHAQAVLEAMIRHMPSATQTTFAIKGRGVNWECTARRDTRFCTITCFGNKDGSECALSFYLVPDDDGPHDPRDQDPLARRAFFRTRIASGRTHFLTETTEAVEAWLQHGSLERLYEQFAFVDEHKRAQRRLQASLVALALGLGEFLQVSQTSWDDFYDLSFVHGERLCRCFYHQGEQTKVVKFLWDERELFSCQSAQVEALVAPLERWVRDHALPSQMRREFPWITIGPLADYYESNNSWQGECLESWDHIEAFYRDPAYNRVPYPEMLHLISQMRAKGYDKTLRAGQSLWTLVLSRSKRHGLREGQPCLRFNFQGPNGVLHINVDYGPPLIFDTRDLTPEIEALLRQLEAHDID